MNEEFEDLSRQAMSLIQQYAAKKNAAVLACLAPIPAKLERLHAQRNEIEKETHRVRRLLQTLISPQPQRPNVNEELASLLSKQPTNSTLSENPSPDPNGYLTSRRERMKLRIEINWPQIVQRGQKEVICDHKASDSLVRFVTRICEELGL